MKIAITTYTGFSAGDICGVSSAPIYLADQLREHLEHTDTVDVLAMRPIKSHLSPLASGVLECTNPKMLEDYDFVIFASPGITCEKYDERTPNKYVDILNHCKKFTFICNDENDRKLYPYHKNFLHHPNMTFVTFNCPGMQNAFQEYIDIVGDWEYVSFSPILKDKDTILEKAKSKSDKIISTSRWTIAKRVLEFLSMSEDFSSRGIDVFSAGSHPSHWYNMSMESIPKDSYVDLGEFEPSMLPGLLEDKKYHWNFLFHKVNLGLRAHQPRIEIASMEALNEGCLPVICEETTPEWLGKDSAVRVSKKEYTDIPRILGEMTDEERLERIERFYDLVNYHSIDHYNEVLDHIRRVL